MESISEEKKRRGRPSETDRDKIKDKRFHFVFSTENINNFGGRTELIDSVKKFVSEKKKEVFKKKTFS